MYLQSERNPNEIYWELVRDLLQVQSHDEVAAWAQLIHFTTHPVYYQNYTVADLIAAQLHHTLEEKYGKVVGAPSTGSFFRNEIFRHGSLYRWTDLIERTTGEPLTADYYVEEWLGE